MSRNNKLAFLLTLSLASAGLCSCTNQGKHLVHYAYGYGTTWEIHLYQGEDKDGEEIVSYINDTSKILDRNPRDCKNGVYVLNKEGYVQADPFLLEAFALSETLKAVCHDAFSITIGSLTEAWLTSLEKGEVLEQAKKEALLQEAKDTHISIEGNIITKTGEGTIDFGAIGKGLCLDHIEKMLQEKGITQYLINAGTSSLLLGEAPEGDGVVKMILSDAKGKYFWAKNCAISTSSISKQQYTIGGKTYSHIIDPRTGDAHVEGQGLYLKGKGAGLLDGLSTGFMVLGKDYLSELTKLDIQYAYVENGEVSHASEGFIL